MFSTMDADEEAHLSSCVCGYHVYNAIWSSIAGEELQCANRIAIEVGNVKDRNVISIIQTPDVVGHLPQ